MVESNVTREELLTWKLQDYWRRPLGAELIRFAEAARGRAMRTRLEFAQECVTLPEGPHKNFNWRPEYQPFCAATLKLMDDTTHRKFRFSGCVQSGKSFIGVICVLWHLLERGEDVGYAVPDLDQSARDKWQKEFLPVLKASPYLRQFLPETGEGSKGGTPTSITFANGSVLRFISGGGGDQHRSNFTVHCVFKTEVDRYDVATESSRETSPPEQIENRTEAHGDLAWSYEECTVTNEDGRIWMEIQEGTNHKMHVFCPKCKKGVSPTREDYYDVEGCDDVQQAADRGHFRCPNCSEQWSEDERQEMLDGMVPVAEGQTVYRRGKRVVLRGSEKPTKKLSVTWNAFFNRFWTTAKIGEDEWTALYSRKPTEMDLKRRQHAWTLPSEPDVFAVTPLMVRDIVERGHDTEVEERHWTRSIPLGYCPPNTLAITAGVDVGKRLLHFVVRAFYKTANGLSTRIIDLGEMPVRSQEVGMKLALVESMFQLDDRFNHGYAEWQNEKTERQVVELRGVDGGWQGNEIGRRQEDLVWYSLLQLEVAKRHGWLQTIGRGQSEPPGKGSYVHPKKHGTGKDPNAVVGIMEQCHVRRSGKHHRAFANAGAANPASYCIFNTDEFKDIVRTGYGDTPIHADGAVCSFNATTKSERELLNKYAQQTCAESRISKYVPGRGRVTVFENENRRPNHFGDADVISMVMASVLELPVTMMPVVEAPTPPKRTSRTPLRNPSGQPYLATQRTE